MYNQNIYPINNVQEQGISLALALSDISMAKGHSGYMAEDLQEHVQAFVPDHLAEKYVSTLEHVFGKDCAINYLSVHRELSE